MKNQPTTSPALPDRLLPLLLLAACAGAALVSVKPEIVHFFTDRALTWGLTLVPGLALGAACAGWGVLLARPLRGALTTAEWLAFSLACGLGAVSLGAGLLGFTGALTTGTAALLVLFGIVQLALQFQCRCRHCPRAEPSDESAWGRAVLVLGALLVGAVVMLTAVSLTPPLLFDVTEYHLGGWTDYLTAAGSVHFTAAPHNFYLRFPFPVESLYYTGLALAPYTDSAPKILNTLTVLACAVLAACAVRRIGFGRAPALVAALVVLGHPVMLEVSLDAMIDAPVALLVAASVYTALIAARLLPGSNPADSPWGIVPPAFLFGAALATKYTVAQIYLLPWLILILPLLWRVGRRHLPALAITALLAGLPCLLWLGKNLWLYGNPLEPFFTRLFRPTDTLAIAREKFYIESHFPQSPLSLQYWQSLLPRLREFGWIILVLATGWRFRPRAPWLLRVLLFTAGAWLLWNTVRESQNRFLLPVIVLMSTVAAGGAFSFPARWQRRLAGSLLVLYAALHLGHHALRVNASGTVDYLLNYEPAARTDRLTTASPTDADTDAPPAPSPRDKFYQTNLGDLGTVLTRINAELPPDARVLLLYEARPYLFTHATGYNVVWDESLLLQHLRGATTVDEAWARLRSAGYTHVLVNRQELLRYIQQYARRTQLRRLGLPPGDDPRAVWGLTPHPDDLYPPHYLDPDWPALQPLVRDFLQDIDTRATIREGTPARVPGVKPLDITVTPVP